MAIAGQLMCWQETLLAVGYLALITFFRLFLYPFDDSLTILLWTESQIFIFLDFIKLVDFGILFSMLLFNSLVKICLFAHDFLTLFLGTINLLKFIYTKFNMSPKTTLTIVMLT